MNCIYETCCDRCEYQDCINDDGICTMYEPDIDEESNEDEDDDEY